MGRMLCRGEVAQNGLRSNAGWLGALANGRWRVGWDDNLGCGWPAGACLSGPMACHAEVTTQASPSGGTSPSGGASPSGGTSPSGGG